MNRSPLFSRFLFVGWTLFTWLAVTHNSQAGPTVATYALDVEVSWSQANHEAWAMPFADVPNPHFSHLGGGTHRNDLVVWEPGRFASPAMETMQESGWIDFPDMDMSTPDLAADFATYLGDGSAHSFLNWQQPFHPGPATTLSFDITTSHPYVSLVTMIGPSPDWFVGVSGLDLRSDQMGTSTNGWINELTIDLFAFDGGTEDGDTEFSLGGTPLPTNVPITKISDTPTINSVGNTALNSMAVGSFTFRLDSVAVPEPSPLLPLIAFAMVSRFIFTKSTSKVEIQT